MSSDQERVPSNGDPFAETDNDALKYVLKRWDLIDAPENTVLVIEGRITEITTSWTVKEGDWLNTKVTYEPDLKCDLLVHNPRAAIIAEDGDLGIVAEVFRQFGTMTGKEAKQIMVAYQHKVYPEPPPKTRVQAGERKVHQQSESVEF